MLGWTHPKETSKDTRLAAVQVKLGEIHQMEADSFLKLLDEAYAAHTKALTKSAQKGTDLHQKLENYVKFCISNNSGKPVPAPSEFIAPFIGWAVANVDKFLWSELHTYSETLWIGGITDAGALMRDGKVAIIDFKSSKDAYPNQFWQIGGYHLQLAENGGFTATGERIVEPIKADQHIIIPFGAKEFTTAVVNKPEANTEAFKAALTLYKANQALE